MPNTRLVPLAIAAIIAAAFAPAPWAAEGDPAGKDPAASQSSQPSDRDASAPAATQSDAKSGNGAESAAPREPEAKAPPRRRVVTAAEIEDMNRRYPGG